MGRAADTHGYPLGYLLWIFGFTGAHRFYYGRKLTGTLWFCTAGLCGIGWLVDLFLIPSMAREAGVRYADGPYSYELGWILLTFLGPFGVHRFYLGKWITGLLWLFSLGGLGIAHVWDLWHMNELVSDANQKAAPSRPRTF